MLSSRAANQLAPLVLRNGRAVAQRHARLPTQAFVIALLAPRRFNSTDTSNRGSNANYPPPGFNAEQAKKPLEQPAASQSKKADVSIPASEPSEHPPTASEETATLNVLDDKVKAHEKATAKKAEEKKNMTLRQKIMKEIHHYWDGTKLLGTEIKISSKLVLKMAAGYELTRRENTGS
jgi:LETM1 and EF-hand domain-containing protein 1